MPVPPSPPAAVPGHLRAAALDALVNGRAAPADAAVLAPWAREVAAAGGGAAIGLDSASVPARWWEVLAWAGVPMALGGAVLWGRAVREEPGIDRPEDHDGVLLLPQPGTLLGLSSLAIRPLRAFCQERFGCRLQSACGLRVWLWPEQAVVINLGDVPAAGFLYGRVPGHRANLALEPGDVQVVRWGPA